MEMQTEQRSTTARHSGSTRLRDAVAELQARYGRQALHDGGDAALVVPPHIASGIDALDALSGCGGLPRGHLSHFTGGSTSGKFFIALRLLAAAQSSRTKRDDVVLLDIPASAAPDALHRAGVDPSHVLFVRPTPRDALGALLCDVLLVRNWRYVLVIGAGRMRDDPALAEAARLTRQRRTALLLMDDDATPVDAYAGSALSHHTSLHLHFERTLWRRTPHAGLYGYTTRVRLERSRWARPGKHCHIEIDI
jgi:hypothetical protein